MTDLRKIAVSVPLVLLIGCSRHDSKVKAYAEEEMERLHQQLEKERRKTNTEDRPSTRPKSTSSCRKATGNTSKALHDLKVP